jgi:hypothetical protein
VINRFGSPEDRLKKSPDDGIFQRVFSIEAHSRIVSFSGKRR